MTFKDYQVVTPHEFYTAMYRKALEIALYTNDPMTRKDDVCISAFLFGIKTWNKEIGDKLEKIIEPNMSFTDVTTKFFQKLATDDHMQNVTDNITLLSK